MQFNIVYKAVSGIDIRETAEIRDKPVRGLFPRAKGNERMLAGNYAANQVRRHEHLASVVSITKSGPATPDVE